LSSSRFSPRTEGDHRRNVQFSQWISRKNYAAIISIGDCLLLQFDALGGRGIAPQIFGEESIVAPELRTAIVGKLVESKAKEHLEQDCSPITSFCPAPRAKCPFASRVRALTGRQCHT
jgi:hypothetical protein